jgi:hypothetical protein
MEDRRNMEPKVYPHGERFVVKRLVAGTWQYWNRRRGQWITDVHGPSARNGKASYFRSTAAAQAEIDRLKTIQRSCDEL